MPTPQELLALDEIALAERVLNEVTGSREYDKLYAAFQMKLILKNQTNAEKTSELNQELVTQTTTLARQTTSLARQTRNLMIATWVLAGITFLTFLASIYFDARKNTASTYTPSTYYEH